jgi:NADPH:quinone reductase-like Zn-dependent oxidoreductase
VDAVIDTVGAATWEHSLRSVRPGGTVVVAGATAGALVKTDLFRLFLQQITIRGSAMGRVGELATWSRCAMPEGSGRTSTRCTASRPRAPPSSASSPATRSARS